MVFLAFTYCFSNSSNVKPCSLGDGALGPFSMFSLLCVMFGLLVVSAREKGKPLKGAKVNMTAPELISQWHVCKLDNCPSLGTDMRSDYLIKGVGSGTPEFSVMVMNSFLSMFTLFSVFPCSTPRCMASFVGPVLLTQAGLNISIRTRRLTLKEVRLGFCI